MDVKKHWENQNKLHPQRSENLMASCRTSVAWLPGLLAGNVAQTLAFSDTHSYPRKVGNWWFWTQPESCGHFHGGIFTTQAIIMGELVLIEGVNPVPWAVDSAHWKGTETLEKSCRQLSGTFWNCHWLRDTIPKICCYKAYTKIISIPIGHFEEDS